MPRARALVPATLVISLSVVVAAAADVATGQAAAPVRPSVDSIVIDDPGFPSPQAALQQFVNGVATGDVDSGAEACATVSLAQHFDWDAFTRYLGGWASDQSYMPSQYEYWRQGNAEVFLDECISTMRFMAMELVTPGSVGRSLGTGYDTNNTSALEAELNPARLSTLRVARFDQIRFAGHFLKLLHEECNWRGGQECASDMALLQMGSSYLLVGPSFVEYDGKWRIASVVGDPGFLLSISSVDGGLLVSKAQYASDLAQVRQTVG